MITNNENGIEVKVCSHCGRELPISEFPKNKTTADGLSHWCKDCCKEYQKNYNKRKRSGKIAKSVVPLVKGIEGSELAKFSPRQLMEELKDRGFHGKLYYTQSIDIDNM